MSFPKVFRYFILSLILVYPITYLSPKTYAYFNAACKDSSGAVVGLAGGQRILDNGFSFNSDDFFGSGENAFINFVPFDSVSSGEKTVSLCGLSRTLLKPNSSNVLTSAIYRVPKTCGSCVVKIFWEDTLDNAKQCSFTVPVFKYSSQKINFLTSDCLKKDSTCIVTKAGATRAVISTYNMDAGNRNGAVSIYLRRALQTNCPSYKFKVLGYTRAFEYDSLSRSCRFSALDITIPTDGSVKAYISSPNYIDAYSVSTSNVNVALYQSLGKAVCTEPQDTIYAPVKTKDAIYKPL